MPANQGLKLYNQLSFRRSYFLCASLLVAFVLAACSTPRPDPVREDPTKCRASAADEPLVGSWLSVRRQSGVAGELRTHIVLRADGTMSYTEQLSRPGKLPQGLSETGCWHRDGQAVVLRTVESNGSPVDLDDPIYVNRYVVTQESGNRVRLQSSDGVRLDARRMPPDYRLPW